MFCGVHVTRPSVMARLPDGASDSIRQGYLPWLRAGERVAAFEHTGGYFAEHSTPERYLESNWALLGGAPLRHPPTRRLVGIDPTARIAPTATIVEPVRIGAGARIAGGRHRRARRRGRGRSAGRALDHAHDCVGRRARVRRRGGADHHVIRSGARTAPRTRTMNE